MRLRDAWMSNNAAVAWFGHLWLSVTLIPERLRWWMCERFWGHDWRDDELFGPPWLECTRCRWTVNFRPDGDAAGPSIVRG